MDFLNIILQALIGMGPVGIIAALELLIILALGYCVWYFLKQKSSIAALTKTHASQIAKLQSDQVEKIGSIHDSYQAQLAELNEKRIIDLKESTADYTELASRTTETLNRLTLQLEIRGSRK